MSTFGIWESDCSKAIKSNKKVIEELINKTSAHHLTYFKTQKLEFLVLPSLKDYRNFLFVVGGFPLLTHPLVKLFFSSAITLLGSDR